MKENGIHITTQEGENHFRVKAMHLHEVQSLYKTPVDIALICTKS